MLLLCCADPSKAAALVAARSVPLGAAPDGDEDLYASYVKFTVDLK